jgi:hypothetical protein
MASKGSFKFKDVHAKKRPEGGIASFRVYPHQDGYRVNLIAYGDMSRAGGYEMTVEVYLGGQKYRSIGQWERRRWGWIFIDRP